MSGNPPDRKARSRLVAVLLCAAVASAAGLGHAGAAEPDGLWDHALEWLNVKATPPEPAPDFVRRTRKDPAGLGYIAPPVPHKVSPVAVKGAAEIEARKAALDAARVRQLAPPVPAPVPLAASKKLAKAKAADQD